jgi:hypothetical protein
MAQDYDTAYLDRHSDNITFGFGRCQQNLERVMNNETGERQAGKSQEMELLQGFGQANHELNGANEPSKRCCAQSPNDGVARQSLF